MLPALPQCVSHRAKAALLAESFAAIAILELAPARELVLALWRFMVENGLFIGFHAGSGD